MNQLVWFPSEGRHLRDLVGCRRTGGKVVSREGPREGRPFCRSPRVPVAGGPRKEQCVPPTLSVFLLPSPSGLSFPSPSHTTTPTVVRRRLPVSGLRVPYGTPLVLRPPPPPPSPVRVEVGLNEHLLLARQRLPLPQRLRPDGELSEHRLQVLLDPREPHAHLLVAAPTLGGRPVVTACHEDEHHRSHSSLPLPRGLSQTFPCPVPQSLEPPRFSVWSQGIPSRLRPVLVFSGSRVKKVVTAVGNGGRKTVVESGRG